MAVSALGDFARADFTWPNSIALSKDGQLHVTDEHDNCVKVYNQDQVLPFEEFDTDGEWQRMWGEAGSDKGQLNGPAGIAFDSNNEAYIVDSKSHRAQKFSAEGEFILGWGGHGSDHGQFNLPWGVTVDSDDNVYVAGWGNHRVQKFTPGGQHLASFGEVDGLGGELRHPSDVAVDSDGDVYVADWGNRRVRIYEPSGDIIAALYGDAVELSKAGEYIVRRDPGTIKATGRSRTTPRWVGSSILPASKSTPRTGSSLRTRAAVCRSTPRTTNTLSPTSSSTWSPDSYAVL